MISKEIETSNSIIVSEKLTLSMASLTTLLCLMIIVSLIFSISFCDNPIGTFVAANFGFGRVIHINSVLSRFLIRYRFLLFSNALQRLETLPELLMKFRTLKIFFGIVVILNLVLFSFSEICIGWVSKHWSNRESPAVASIT